MGTSWVVAAGLVALLLGACSGKPNNEAIADLIQNSYGEVDGKPWVEVVNLEKHNGVERSETDYVVDLSFDLVFRKDFAAVAAELARNAPDHPFREMLVKTQIGTLKLQYGDFKAGDRIRQAGRYALVKTEKGWRVDDGTWSRSPLSSDAGLFDD